MHEAAREDVAQPFGRPPVVSHRLAPRHRRAQALLIQRLRDLQLVKRADERPMHLERAVGNDDGPLEFAVRLRRRGASTTTSVSGTDTSAAGRSAKRERARPHRQLPHVMNFSFSLQQYVGFRTIVEAGYVGSLGRNLLWRRNINSIPVGTNFLPSSIDPTNKSAYATSFLRPMIGYNDVLMTEAASSSNYHGGHITARRRMTKGVQFGLSWTWSKAMDFNDNDVDAISSLVSPRVWNYSLAGFDRTHLFKFNWVWSLPKTPFKAAVLKQAFNGWQLSGITSFLSGAPLGVGFTSATGVGFHRHRDPGRAHRGAFESIASQGRSRFLSQLPYRRIRPAQRSARSATPRATSCADPVSTTGICRSSRNSRSASRCASSSAPKPTTPSITRSSPPGHHRPLRCRRKTDQRAAEFFHRRTQPAYHAICAEVLFLTAIPIRRAWILSGCYSRPRR